MPERSSTLIESRIKQHREWLAQAEQFRMRQIEYIERDLEGDTLNSLDGLSEWIAFLGTFYGTRGTVATYNRDMGGWSDIFGAIECYRWSVRLQISTYYSLFAPHRSQRVVFLQSRLPLAVSLLAYSAASGDARREQEVWSLLQAPICDPDLEVNEWWRARHFEPVLINLYAKTRGYAPPFDPSQFDPDVYRPLSEQWDNGEAVAAALHEACDYHLQHVEDDDDFAAGFVQPPLDLIPAEIFALNRLRTATGLNPVEVDHPLVHAIGPIIEAAPPRELIDILSRIQAKYSEFFLE